MPIGVQVFYGNGQLQFDGTTNTSRIIGRVTLNMDARVSDGAWRDQSYSPPEGPVDFCYFAGGTPRGSGRLGGTFCWVEGGVIRTRSYAYPPYGTDTSHGNLTIVYGRY